MGVLSLQNFISQLNSTSNNAWITGFQQNVLGATFASAGLGGFLPQILDDPVRNLLDGCVQVNPSLTYTAFGITNAITSPPQFVTTPVLSGSQSLWIPPTNAAGLSVLIQTPIFRVQGGQGYTSTVMMQCDVGVGAYSLGLALVYLDANGNYLNATFFNPTTTVAANTWQLYTSTNLPAPTNARYGLMVAASGGLVGNAYLDELTLKQTWTGAGSDYGTIQSVSNQTGILNNGVITFAGGTANTTVGISFSGGKFTVTSAGIYAVGYNVALSTESVAGQAFLFISNGVVGTPTLLGGAAGAVIATTGDNAWGGTALLSLAANATVAVSYQGLGTVTAIGDDCNFWITRIA